MFAPAALSSLVSSIFSASEIPGTGAGNSADPPPVRRQMHKSLGPSDDTISRIRSRAFNTLGARFVHAGRPRRMKMNALRWHDAIGRHIDPARDVLFCEEFRPKNYFECHRHRTRRFAGADDRDPLDGAQIDRVVAHNEPIAINVHVIGHKPIRQNGCEARPPDSFDIGAKLIGVGGHGQLLILARRPANVPLLAPAQSAIGGR